MGLMSIFRNCRCQYPQSSNNSHLYKVVDELTSINYTNKQEKDKNNDFFFSYPSVRVMFRYLQVGIGVVYYTLIAEHRGSDFHKPKNGSGDFAGFRGRGRMRRWRLILKFAGFKHFGLMGISILLSNKVWAQAEVKIYQPKI